MSKYLALMIGTGDGCDYTLGCNKTWVLKEANNIDEFRMSVLKDFGMLHFNTDVPDILIESMDIFEICGETQGVTKIPEWYFQQHELFQIKKKEDEERALYEQLKEKFEK